MAATQRCSECNGDLGNPSITPMHMAGVQGGIVCGVTGRLGHVEGGIAPEPDPSVADLKAEIASLKNRIATAASYHGRSIDPSECQECADGHFPCRTVIALDG